MTVSLVVSSHSHSYQLAILLSEVGCRPSSMPIPREAAMSAIPPATLIVMMSMSWEALTVAELGVQFSGLCVDHQSLDGHCVVLEEDVRQRAVTPEATRQVQFDEQSGESSQHLSAPFTETGSFEELPV